ncbi:MAG: hypothetical protein GY928_37240 [Colwellia sp.]|nr:hypothetical protein [Colwellia sp.]
MHVNRPNLVPNDRLGSVVNENMFSPKVPLGEKVAHLFQIWVRSQNGIFSKKIKMIFFAKYVAIFKCNTSKSIFLSQGIHFWGCFCDLTPKTQNRGQNDPFCGQNWVKIDFFWKSF